MAAGDVAFAGDTLAHMETGNTVAQSGDLADVLVADGLAGLHVLSCPVVPLIDVNVGAADSGLMNLDENFASLGLGNGNLPQLQANTCNGLNNGVHVLFHDRPPIIYHSGAVYLPFNILTVYPAFCKRNMEKTEGKMEGMHKKITAEPV
jgi:hypothetical protein